MTLQESDCRCQAVAVAGHLQLCHECRNSDRNPCTKGPKKIKTNLKIATSLFFYCFFLCRTVTPGATRGEFFINPRKGPGDLECEKPEIAKKNVTPPTFWKLLWYLRTPRKKIYIPVFHAGGHCGLRFIHFIDFLAIF